MQKITGAVDIYADAAPVILRCSEGKRLPGYW